MPIQGAILSAFASQESSAQNSSPLKLKMAREPRRNSISAAALCDARPDGNVARVEVDKAEKSVRALNADGTLVAFYPATIGSAEKPAPSGSYRVRKVAYNPTYHYDPKFHF